MNNEDISWSQKWHFGPDAQFMTRVCTPHHHITCRPLHFHFKIYGSQLHNVTVSSWAN